MTRPSVAAGVDTVRTMRHRPTRSLSLTIVSVAVAAAAVSAAGHPALGDLVQPDGEGPSTLATATQPAVRTLAPAAAGSVPGSSIAMAIDLTNRARVAAGLAPLRPDDTLAAAAREHSADQAGRGRIGHIGSDGSTAGDRIARNGGSFRTWGENVAAGHATAADVIAAWMTSEGHRDILLGGEFRRVGVAVAYDADGTPYWTLVVAG